MNSCTLYSQLNSTQVQIIKRGTRSLGYGFVTYATESEAQKAVSLLNKREIAGREINVEGAKPQTEAQAVGASTRGGKRTRGRGRGQGVSSHMSDE